jgi:hypothetical protein
MGNVYLKLTVQNLPILLIETFFTLVSTYQNITCLLNIFSSSEYYILFMMHLEFILEEFNMCSPCYEADVWHHTPLFILGTRIGVPFTWMSENCFSTTCRPGSWVLQLFSKYIAYNMHSVINRLWHVSTPACFGTEVLSSGSHYSKVHKPTCQFVCSSYTNDKTLQMLKYTKMITKKYTLKYD